jgi:protein SCO1
MSPGQPRKSDRLAVTIACAFSVATIGCSQPAPPWGSTDIKGFMPDLELALTDGQGRAVTAASFRGKPCLLYFGFTHCEGICPTTLHTLAAAVRELGPEADRVHVLFVSVDPKRDTPAVLARYEARFGPQVVGLTGEMQELKTLARRYRVAFGYGAPDADGDYAVNHSNAIFAFDGSGRARLLMREESGAQALAADIRRLVEERGDAPISRP